jgi:hypothetical protein
MLVQDSKVILRIMKKWEVTAVFNRKDLGARVAADDKISTGTKNIIVTKGHGDRKRRMF